VNGVFAGLGAKDAAAAFNVNFHKEKDKYENQNKRQSG